jgi:hypothetical protein
MSPTAELTLLNAAGRPLCPECHLPMFKVHIEPEKADDEQRIFKCPGCDLSEIFIRVSPTIIP